MNLVVQRARHPQLREYIHSAVTALLPFIQEEKVDRVAVIFFSSENIPLERFIFKLMVNQSYNSNVERHDLESTLRLFLIKLPVSESMQKVLPHNSRWQITAYFWSIPQQSDGKNVEFWIPTDVKQWQQPPGITPIKSLSDEPLRLQLYWELPSPSEAMHLAGEK